MTTAGFPAVDPRVRPEREGNPAAWCSLHGGLSAEHIPDLCDRLAFGHFLKQGAQRPSRTPVPNSGVQCRARIARVRIFFRPPIDQPEGPQGSQIAGDAGVDCRMLDLPSAAGFDDDGGNASSRQLCRGRVNEPGLIVALYHRRTGPTSFRETQKPVSCWSCGAMTAIEGVCGSRSFFA